MLTNAEIIQRWRDEVVALGDRLDSENDKEGHDWHSLWTGFVIGRGRHDLTSRTMYMRLGFPVEASRHEEAP